MKRFALLLCFLSPALAVHAAASPTDAGLAEIRDLGRLNGQALACDFAGTAARIKSVMIQHAPKSRRYGAAFEEATNEAFLVQSRKEAATCPDGPTLNGNVETATQSLLTALPPAPARAP